MSTEVFTNLTTTAEVPSNSVTGIATAQPASESLGAGSPAEQYAPVQSSPVVGMIDEVRKQAFQVKFNETINNPRFWARPSRVSGLDTALDIPMFEDRSLQQFYNHATDDLINEAAKRSARTGEPVVMPTEEEVIAEVWKRCLEKYIGLERRALTKERRLEADKTGRPIVRVTDTEIRERAEAAVEALRKTENM